MISGTELATANRRSPYEPETGLRNRGWGGCHQRCWARDTGHRFGVGLQFAAGAGVHNQRNNNREAKNQ